MQITPMVSTLVDSFNELYSKKYPDYKLVIERSYSIEYTVQSLLLEPRTVKFGSYTDLDVALNKCDSLTKNGKPAKITKVDLSFAIVNNKSEEAKLRKKHLAFSHGRFWCSEYKKYLSSMNHYFKAKLSALNSVVPSVGHLVKELNSAGFTNTEIISLMDDLVKSNISNAKRS